MIMKISLNGVDITVESSINRRFDPVELTTFEKPIVNSVLEIIYRKIDPSFVHLERRSDNYLSIVAFEDDDFCRIKAGAKAKWISLALGYNDDYKQYIDDPIFSSQKNKRQRHWKISLTPNISIKDVQKYIERVAENSLIAHT